jgi:hypothetical protein
MRHHKYFKQLNNLSPNRDIGYIEGRAKSGKSLELKSAKRVHALLRDYTYHLIGLGNTFRDIARIHGEFDGSAWRSYQGVLGTELKSLAEKLNHMDPYDVDAILDIERAIEKLADTMVIKK